MSGENTLTSLNSNFKYVQSKLKNLVPENSVLLKSLPAIESAQTLGRKYLQSVQVSPEQGFTYGDGTAFALNSQVNGVYQEAQIDAQPLVLNSVVSESAANRLANKEQFLGEGVQRTLGMYESMARRAEISMLYGQSGIGTTASSANASATSTVITLTEASWSDGIWSGSTNAVLNFYNGASLVSSGADADFSVSAVDADNFKITVTGTSTGIAALDTSIGSGARTAYYKGSKTNDMLGLNAQVVGGATFFNIDPTVYSLWQGCTYGAGSAALTMSKALGALAKPVARGGLNTDVELHVCAATHKDLNADQAALRVYDGQGYSAKDAKNGSEGITYQGPVKITVVLNNVVKRGEAFIFPMKHIKRIGAKDIGWVSWDGKADSYFKMLESTAGFQIRMSHEMCVFLEMPARACKITGIVNNA